MQTSFFYLKNATQARMFSSLRGFKLVLIIFLVALLSAPIVFAAGDAAATAFPTPLDGYEYQAEFDAEDLSILEILSLRLSEAPFNLIASLVFLLAIIHTFAANKIVAWSHAAKHKFEDKYKASGRELGNAVSFKAEILHFLGEVEAIFGIWVVVMMSLVFVWYDWGTASHYVNDTVVYIEPMFVFVIMALAATRPILSLTEKIMSLFASIGGKSVAAWWFSILTIGPLLGSFITEPAAMVVCALLLSAKFYDLKPSKAFAYATIGLLFVNISVGGTLTHFAAPPVLLVARPWDWGFVFMLTHYGWKSALGIVIANIVYFVAFRKELSRLNEEAKKLPAKTEEEKVPLWVTLVHIAFMVWTVFNAHYPALFLGGLLFFLGFYKATRQHQDKLQLLPALLVGFFLAGLVNHGGLQGWWIEPIVSRLDPLSLKIGAVILTAFNDNAAITYLATLVPNFSLDQKYSVLAGAVVGGGLTVIANAPNPAGYSILNKHFGGISPLWLLVGALIPTLILGTILMTLPPFP